MKKFLIGFLMMFCFLNIMFAGDKQVKEIITIHKSSGVSLERGSYITISTVCIDGYKYLLTNKVHKNAQLIQMFVKSESRRNTYEPAKCE